MQKAQSGDEAEFSVLQPMMPTDWLKKSRIHQLQHSPNLTLLSRGSFGVDLSQDFLD
jgi:hypothetical protein